MANEYDPKNSSDNWDEQPKYDGDASANHYRQYTSPNGNGNGNGIFPDHFGQPQRDQEGSTARTLGIVGIFVTLCFCQLAGIILGIIAFKKARNSARTLGYETSDAAVGRVLGIVSVVLGCLFIIVSIIYVAVMVATGTFASMIEDANAELLASATFPLSL